MNLITLTSFLLLSLTVLNQAGFSDAFGTCCARAGWFSCCGRGKCNALCCECDGGCKSGCPRTNSLNEGIEN